MLACMQLPSIGVAPEFISFKNVSLESERYICVRETGAQNNVVIVDMSSPLSPARRQITADSALMCLDKKVIALKAAATGGDALQVFNLDTKTKLAAHQMPEPVEFWKWISPTTLGLVTASSVFHWTVEVGILSMRPHRNSACFQQKHCYAESALCLLPCVPSCVHKEVAGVDGPENRTCQ